MAYNIILQAMSTLNIQKEGNYIKKCWFSMSEKLNEAILYYSQLEPVSVMMIKRNIVPDMILSLCTKQTLEPTDFALEENPNEVFSMTAYEFYRSRIKAILPKGASTIFQPIDIDERDINAGIVNAAEQILAVKKELEQKNIDAEDKKIKLWVNTQGGFRDISLVLNAIVNLMSAYEIEIADIYSMPFGNKKGGTPIESKMQNYQIFDFVVGMKEFLNYGRADTLEKYYQATLSDNMKEYEKNQVESLINTMKNVADAIQMCDPVRFNEGLIELREKINDYKESGAQFFDIFVEKIKEEYGILLTEKYTTLDVVKWFCEKEFYQQALTYIEAFVPTELVNKKIIVWKYDKEKVDALKELGHRGYVVDANYLLYSFSGVGAKKSGNMKEKFRRNLKEGRFKIFEKGQSTIVRLKKPLINMKEEKREFFIEFIDKYYVMKELRNEFNHMSEDKERITKSDLIDQIEAFESLGRTLYNLYQ